MRLKIELFRNWSQQNNPNGPATFVRQGSTNAFQVSWAEYRGDKPLNTGGEEGTRQFAVNFGKKFGELVESSSGTCRFGIFGTAFRSATYPRIQVWILTNNRDHILATHICSAYLSADEIAEVQKIAASLALGPDLPAPE